MLARFGAGLLPWAADRSGKPSQQLEQPNGADRQSPLLRQFPEPGQMGTGEQPNVHSVVQRQASAQSMPPVQVPSAVHSIRHGPEVHVIDPLQLDSAVHATVQLPSRQVTVPEQAPSLVHDTSQALARSQSIAPEQVSAPPQVTSHSSASAQLIAPPQALWPLQMMLHALAAPQCTPPAHAPSPAHCTSHALPSGQIISAPQLPGPSHTTVQMPSVQVLQGAGQAPPSLASLLTVQKPPSHARPPAQSLMNVHTNWSERRSIVQLAVAATAIARPAKRAVA
jgi:hypothetical protein